ncbi:MAG: cadmium-translocating P-type ATPase [Chloroflexi bacterium]|nr:cadmium-translocating P-type ATPase [Chloroflexota bacterium]OJV99085.1 MAG: ATPase P [Chloroflexi bacterium 54-19]
MFENSGTRKLQTLELPVKGMDCADCTIHVQKALTELEGVESAKVLLSAEKAVINFDPVKVGPAALRRSIEKAGYSVPVQASPVLALETIELPVVGMDCADCTVHVQKAIAALPGIDTVRVLLSAEKAVITLDPQKSDLNAIHQAVKEAGYTIPQTHLPAAFASTQETYQEPDNPKLPNYLNSILTLLGLILGVVLFVIVVGEWLGLFDTLTDKVPWPVGWLIVGIAGYPIFLNVIKASLRGRIISHTLMSLGAIAALAVGQWPTAVVVVFFMRVGEYAEKFTTERSRQALKNLTSMAPQTARVERNGTEQEVPVGDVRPGEVVVVRPGEKIPVDGFVVSGQATVEQAAITGESIPVEVSDGVGVYAATIARLGSLRVQATHVGTDTTFGKAVKMVEEAEAHRSDVQLIADKFSAYYLPVVVAVAAISFLFTRNTLASAAVLVVACSCSFALATPIAMLASIGAAAKRGLLIKGGKYLELLAGAQVLLVDKTGTLTAGRPRITDIVPLTGKTPDEVLRLAAAAERYSEHPLAQAVLEAAAKKEIEVGEPRQFKSMPGLGVQALVDGLPVTVGNRRMKETGENLKEAAALEEQGKTLLYVVQNDELIGILAAADTLRPEVPQALAAVRKLGIKRIELLTGDNERTGRALAANLGIDFRANLLPEDKIKIVREYQDQGYKVVMVGDGVNDAPALAQAEVGMAMGVVGTDVAVDAAHMALMRDDWRLVPEAIAIAQRTMRVVKVNFAFTALYNLVGLSLAATGFLPMIVAAAAQSIPDFGILANSSRLLKYRPLKFEGELIPIPAAPLQKARPTRVQPIAAPNPAKAKTSPTSLEFLPLKGKKVAAITDQPEKESISCDCESCSKVSQQPMVNEKVWPVLPLAPKQKDQ